METYLYGLLGLSLAANAASFISTMVANSKKRDEENERYLGSVHQELSNKIEKLEDSIYQNISREVRELNETIGEIERDISSRLEYLEGEISRISDESFTKLCATSKKKRNG